MLIQQPLRVVTPTMDGPVLTILALAQESFTAAQLSRMLPYSDEGIRKVLRRLDEQGIVDSERHGHATTYRLNRDHLAAEPIVALAKLKSTLIERIERDLAAWDHPAMYAAVFGSAGRGSMKSSSDIDLLLIRRDGDEDPVWLSQVAHLVDSITRWTGNDTRVLEFAQHEVHSGELVLQDVLREGLTVAGSPSWFRNRMRSRTRQ